MPISITCPQCQKKLKAPDSMAGKKVRCAGCKAVLDVPAPDEELVAPDDELVTPDDEPTQPAKETGVTESPKSEKKKKSAWDDAVESDERKPKDDGGYGLDEKDESERKRRKKKQQKRYDEDDDNDDDDDDRDDFRDRRPRRRAEPHRGVAILVLGILSIVVACACPLICWILAAIAVNMGNTDKPKMERGLMDQSGAGMTTAGIVCAYIGTILGLINLVAGVALRMSGNF